MIQTRLTVVLLMCVVLLCFAFAFANYVITFHKYLENDNTHTLSETVLVFD